MRTLIREYKWPYYGLLVSQRKKKSQTQVRIRTFKIMLLAMMKTSVYTYAGVLSTVQGYIGLQIQNPIAVIWNIILKRPMIRLLKLFGIQNRSRGNCMHCCICGICLKIDSSQSLKLQQNSSWKFKKKE